MKSFQIIRRYLNFILVISAFGFVTQFACAQNTKGDDWRLKKNEKGIQIFTRRPENSTIDELKIVSVMHASLSTIVSVILDANGYPDWIYACEQAKVLKQVSPTEQYQYQLMDVPSPFSDRDAIIHLTVWQDPKTKIVYTKSQAAPTYLPPKEGLVRLPVFDAAYELIPIGNGDVQVNYNLRIDPGGYIPDWLVNLTIVTGPYQSTLKMHEQTKKAQYAQSKLNFILEP